MTSQSRFQLQRDERRQIATFLAFIVVSLVGVLFVVLSRSEWSTERWEQLGALGAASQGLAVLAALVVALIQLAHMRNSSAVDRTIEIHREFTDGPTGAARHRLAGYLYEVGHREGLGHRRTRQPSESDLDPAGSLRHYPDAWPNETATVPIALVNPGQPIDLLRPTVNQDVHSVLWFFQRVESARQHGVLDEGLLHSLLGYHAVRWDCTLDGIEASESRRQLRELALWACGSASPIDRVRWRTRLYRMHATVPRDIELALAD